MAYIWICQFLSCDELNKIKVLRKKCGKLNKTYSYGKNNIKQFVIRSGKIMKWDSNNKLIPITDSMIDAVELSSAKNSNIPGVQEACKSKDVFVVLNSTSNQPPTAKSGKQSEKS